MVSLGESLLNIFTFVLMAGGLFGLVIPIFPGILVMWLAALVFGIVHGFGTLGGWMFALISVLAVVGMTVDNLFVGAGAKKGGASWAAIAIGVIAAIVGTFVIPIIGGIIFFFLAVYLYEYSQHQDHPRALASLKGMMAGWGLAFVVRFFIGLVMIASWVIWAWKG